MSQLAASSRWRFSGFEFDGRTGEIRRGIFRVFLPAQPATVLGALLERPGDLVGRGALIQGLWGGHGLVDAEHGLNAAVNRLRAILGDTARRPRFVETVPGRGYRFVAECQAVEGLAAGFTALVVLPFEAFGETKAQVLADELTEEVTTTLSLRLPLRVVSRVSASTYRGVRRLLPEIGSELGVEVALQGGLLLSAERAHLSVDLLDARADAHLWAGTFDAEANDPLQAVASLAEAVVREVCAKLAPARHGRARGSRRGRLE